MKSKRIVSSEYIDPREVYAIETSTGTYIADGLYHHNCPGCNMFRNGEPQLYREELIARYGEEEVARLLTTYLDWKAGKTKKTPTIELESLIAVYTGKANRLKQKLDEQ